MRCRLSIVVPLPFCKCCFESINNLLKKSEALPVPDPGEEPEVLCGREFVEEDVVLRADSRHLADLLHLVAVGDVVAEDVRLPRRRRRHAWKRIGTAALGTEIGTWGFIRHYDCVTRVSLVAIHFSVGII